MSRAGVAAVAFAAAALRVIAQPAVATVRGRVVADDDGSPLRNVRVTVAPDVIGRAVVLTDDGGRFAVALLPGTTRVVASKPGYGRVEVSGEAIQRPIEIRLPRGAAVSGRVSDEAGEPVQNARVVAQPAGAGRNNPAAAATTTDDRGDYRLAGLSPGSYLIVAMVAVVAVPERVGDGIAIRPRFVSIYHPASITADGAEALSLSAGDDRPRVDFAIRGARTSGPISMLYQLGPLDRPPTARAGERATAILRGHVVGSDGRAVANAFLRLDARDRREYAAGRADAEGRFEFRDLPPGRYLIAAGKAGYALALDTPPIVVREGDVVERIEIALHRLGSIAGRVVDENGEPLYGAAVQVLQMRFEAGRRRLVSAGAAALTDDLGRYRITDVAPGRYIVSASADDVRSAELPGYARAFHPGTPDAGRAQFVPVADGQDVAAIDLSMSRTRTARVAGRLIDAAGRPAGGRVMLMPTRTAAAITYVGAGARITPDGRFEFANVTDGQYVIHVSRGRLNTSTEGEFGALPVTVNGANVVGLTVQTSAGSAIRGHFTFDTRDRDRIPARSGFELIPVPTDPDASPASVASADIHDDWTFRIGGVNGPRRLTLVRAPDGWTLQQIRINGLDTIDRVVAFGRADQSLNDVEVIVTDRVSVLSGTVEADSLPPSARVVVFPVDRARWYTASRFLRTVAVTSGGAFTVKGLPFGSYLVAAVARLPDEGDDAWQDPDFLERLVQPAASVMVREGETARLQLRGFSAK